MKTKTPVAILALLLSILVFASSAIAKPSEFDLISRHLKQHYKAKKVSIPFLFLAKAIVHIAKPAGVKSFGVSLYSDLQFSFDTIDTEMQQAMRSSFGPEWTSVFHVRSRDGQQAYMYMKEDGNDVKLAVVTIEKDGAAIIRATISPDRLASFINDPSVFGISLGDKNSEKQPPQTPTSIDPDH
jgi:hypothetical protein